jgi:hypothetical protein
VRRLRFRAASFVTRSSLDNAPRALSNAENWPL